MNKNKDFFNSLSVGNHNSCRDVVDNDKAFSVISKVIQSVQFTQPVRWLDVGCGKGGSYLIAQQLGYEYCGIDCSINNIQYCRDKFPKGNFILGDFIEFIPIEKFNLVTFVSSLHHFEDWKRAITKASDILAPKGIIYVECEPNRLYATLFKYWSRFIKHIDLSIIKDVDIHSFEKSILPSELPEGKVEFHCDFVPIIKNFGFKTNNVFWGKFLSLYRKIIEAKK